MLLLVAGGKSIPVVHNLVRDLDGSEAGASMLRPLALTHPPEGAV